MRRSSEFATVIRAGRRVRRGNLVVHMHPEISAPGTDAPRVGLVVGKGVGASVVRHRVSRRLRAQLAARLGVLPAGSGVVVRALSGSGQDDSVCLAADLDAALSRLVGGR
ncbi:MAG: ribonuclease P protein component [Actinomycetota bacterium]|nr:ribonuclease P protein component [Actinomycetota bacterium]